MGEASQKVSIRSLRILYVDAFNEPRTGIRKRYHLTHRPREPADSRNDENYRTRKKTSMVTFHMSHLTTAERIEKLGFNGVKK